MNVPRRLHDVATAREAMRGLTAQQHKAAHKIARAFQPSELPASFLDWRRSGRRGLGWRVERDCRSKLRGLVGRSRGRGSGSGSGGGDDDGSDGPEYTDAGA